MSDTSQGPGWWIASDGKWYPPETHPSYMPGALAAGAVDTESVPAAEGALGATAATEATPSLDEEDPADEGSELSRTPLLGALLATAILFVVIGVVFALAVHHDTIPQPDAANAAHNASNLPAQTLRPGVSATTTTTTQPSKTLTPGSPTTTGPKSATTTTAPGGTGTTTTTTLPAINVATASPTTLEYLAVSAMNKAGTTAYTVTSTYTETVSGKSVQAKETDKQQATQTSGTQDITIKSAALTFVGTEIFVNKVAYLKGNAAALKRQFGTTTTKANQFAGKWVSVPSTNADYSQAAAGMTLGQVEGQFEPASPLTSKGISTVDGHSVVGITGSLPATQTKGSSTITGTATLYLLASAPYTPVEFTSTEVQSAANSANKDAAKVTVTFTSWGSTFSFGAPAGAVSAKTVQPTAKTGKTAGKTTKTATAPPATTAALAAPRPPAWR